MKIHIENLNSAGIYSEMRRIGIEEIELIGAFSPIKPCPYNSEADQIIRIYEFPNGYRVADTNGDPIWEACDAQGWEELMNDFGIEL